MALVLQDRVRETSASTGTGTITLGGAYTGYRTFSSCVPTGSIVYYCIQNTASGTEDEWEVGYGTYTSSGNTLSRDHVYDSSNAGSLVPFTGPSQLNVFITQPADQAVYQQVNGDLILINGVIGVSEDGTTGTTLPNTSFQAFATGDYYMQANQQNLSSGANASSDWVSTADNGSDTDNFIDMGMASSGYNYPDFGAQDANSGYIISTGENLQLVAGKYGANVAAANASATDIVFVAGDLLKSGVRGTIKGDTGNWVLGPYGTTDTGETLQVTGNAAVTGVTTFDSYVYSAANVSTAANSTVLTTKEYVDASASTAFVVHPSVVYATAAVLPNSPNYNNGTGGVGANLVATTNGALVIDGVELSDPADVGIRVLVKSQANAAHNGCYTVTAVGGPSATWELTRATDFDTAGAGEIANNAYFYVTAGDTQIGSSWILSQLSAITVGTTNLPFSLFASPIGYTVEAPLQLDGTTLSLAGVVDVAHGGTNLSSYTSGDLIYASGATTLSKRAISSNTGAPLIVSGGVPNWGTIDLSSSNAVSSTLGATNGGTGFSTYTLGDLIYSSATNTLSKLAGQTTTTKKYLQQQGDGVNSAAPSWQQIAAADISGLAPSATTDTSNATNITSGTLPTGRLSGSYTGVTGVGNLTAGTWSANVIGTTYGGTGAAGTLTGLAYANGASAYTAATGSQVVAVIGTTPVANATYAVSANSATYATNIIGTAVGGIPYQTSANTTAVGSALTFNGTTLAATALTVSGAANLATSSGSVHIATTSTYGTNSKVSVYGSVVAGDSGVVLSDGSTTTVGMSLATPATGSVPYVFGNNNLAFGTSGAERMRITSGGSVGIGTTTPQQALDVSTASQYQMRFSGTSASNGCAIQGYSNSDAVAFGVGGNTGGVFGASTSFIGSLTNVPLLFITNGTEKARLDSNGYLGIGTSSPSKKLSVNGDIRLGDGGGTGAFFTDASNGLRFMLPAVGTSTTEAMRLDSSGNLGIGTASPSKGLQVQSSSSENQRTLRLAYDGTYYADIAQAGAGGLYYRVFGGLNHVWEYGGTEAMRIDSSGRLGIGTASPGAKLAVVGTGYSPNIALTDAATVAWDTSTGQVATFTFVSNSRTMGAPTNLVNGGFYALAVIQSTGSMTLTWNSVFKFAGGAAPTLSTAASAKDYFVFRSDGTNLYCQGYSLGVA